MTLLIPNRKDDPPRDTPEPLHLPRTAPVTPPEPSVSSYRAIMERARDRQLELTRENLNRLAQTYDRAPNTILERVRALPDSVERNGTGWLRAQLNLIRDIDEQIERFRRDYGTLLDMSMLSSAQQVADREEEVARLVGAPQDPRLIVSLQRSATLTDGVQVAVRFGTLAQGAVERVAARYYSDGLVLKRFLD